VSEHDDRLFPTSHLRDGCLIGEVVLEKNSIGLFDGPPGTGKTTTAEWIAGEADRPVAFVTMPARPSPLDILRLIILEVSGVAPSARDTKFDMEQTLLNDLLPGWNGLLIVDEVQNLATEAIEELRFLHDRMRRSFAVILVGYRAEEKITSQPALSSRVSNRVHFRALVGDELMECVRHLDPRFAASPVAILRHIDDRCARGNLRIWTHLAEDLDLIGAREGLTVKQANLLIGMRGQSAA
jgi:replication-associated recombination protein RarA